MAFHLMIRKIAGLLLLILIHIACQEDVVQKPHKLLSRDKMISVLVDIHLSDAAFQTGRYSNGQINKYTESDYYYSVLRKYNIADSVFETSLIYYSAKPKEYEKIYTRVINRLTEIEQEASKKTNRPVDLKKPE
jgi:hypothetical protein